MSGGPFLYPNVTSLPAQPGVTPDRPGKVDKGAKEEFDKFFEQAITQGPAKDMDFVKAPLKFSAHAAQRLHDRKITLDPATMTKVNDAIDKAAAKGVEDTLILTKDAALIVSVKNRTVITAMDRGQMNGNVFTNIDGAVIV